jgi:hypothetical protein
VLGPSVYLVAERRYAPKHGGGYCIDDGDSGGGCVSVRLPPWVKPDVEGGAVATSVAGYFIGLQNMLRVGIGVNKKATDT